MDIISNPAASPSGASPGAPSGHMAFWPEEWRRPQGGRAIVASLILFGLMLLAGGVVYATGGTAYAWVHLMYVPVILAAAVFGIRGGLLGGVLAGLVLGPFMPHEAARALPQETANWMLRAFFLTLAGGCSGLLFSSLNRQLEQLRKTHRQLVRTHEELKAAQMKLIQNAKMESVGRLAAGVAHEVKNPLAVIQLGIDFIRQAVRNDDALAETAHDMDDAVKRADTVIKGLLDFSRSEQLSLTPGDVNTVIEETLLLVKHELTKNCITLDKSLEPNLPPVSLDRNKIKQVFINLFMNAIQAMGSEGDTLTVRTRRQRPGEVPDGRTSASAGGSRPAGEQVVVEVEDTGTGIPEDKLDKLFDPFFTTKAVGSGTGLGLSVSRKIVELHGASVTLANRKNRGAAARIVFNTSPKD